MIYIYIFITLYLYIHAYVYICVHIYTYTYIYLLFSLSADNHDFSVFMDQQICDHIYTYTYIYLLFLLIHDKIAITLTITPKWHGLTPRPCSEAPIMDTLSASLQTVAAAGPGRILISPNVFR